MYELANDINGDPVEVPETARFWRLRRHLGGRGASIVVTNEDNSAVLLPISASYAEFHEAVRGGAGKYTLYPCDEQGRPLKGAPVAHVFLGEAPRNSNAVPQPTTADPVSQLVALLRETVEANTAMCKEVIGKYAGTLTSNAELIRAVDGAGVPTRQPAGAVEAEDVEEDEGDEEYEPTMAEIAIKQASDALVMWMKLRTENNAAPAPTPKAEPAAKAEAKPATEKPKAEPAPAPKQEAPKAEPPKQASGVPTSAQMGHLFLVKSKLEPREAKVVEAAIAKMPPDERASWIAELCSRSVEDAAALVRDVIKQTKNADAAKKEGAS